MKASPAALRAAAEAVPPPSATTVEFALALCAAALGGFAWGAPIAIQMIGDSDFPLHLQAAVAFATDGRITVPHFLLQVLLGAFIASGVAGSPQLTGIVFFAALYAVTAALVFWYIARGSTSRLALVSSVLIACAVVMAAPLLPHVELDPYLIGFFPANPYHNPTSILARPLLVLSLVAAVASVAGIGWPRPGELVRLALPIALLGLAKPNYLSCLVPVVALTALWRARRGRIVSWGRVAAICGAAVLVLGITYGLYRSDALGFEGGIQFAPLLVIGLYAPDDPATIVSRLLASLAFPLAVTALWPRDAWKQMDMCLAWSAAAMGLLISYTLAETGPRVDHGNFLWTGQMAVFVLFVASARFFRISIDGREWRSPRVLLAAGVLALHVESGIRHVMVQVEPSAWLLWMT